MSEEVWKEIRRVLDGNAGHLLQVIFTLDSGEKYFSTDPQEMALRNKVVDVYHADGSVTRFPISKICSVSYTLED